jgi:hypothetical protein
MPQDTARTAADQAHRLIVVIETWARPRIEAWKRARGDLEAALRGAPSHPTPGALSQVAEAIRAHGLAPWLAAQRPTVEALLDDRRRAWAQWLEALQLAMAGDLGRAAALADAIDPVERQALEELTPPRLVNAWLAGHIEDWTEALRQSVVAAGFDFSQAERASTSSLLSDDARFILSAMLPRLKTATAAQATPAQSQPPPPAAAEPATGTHPPLARIYGPVIGALPNLLTIACDSTLTVDEKLAALHRLVPIADDRTAEQIAADLSVSKSSVIRTNWWRNRQARLDAERSCRRDARRGTLY